MINGELNLTGLGDKNDKKTEKRLKCRENTIWAESSGTRNGTGEDLFDDWGLKCNIV